jgi:lysophospholipase L1-like esterase
MEPALADLLAELDAAAYVLDTLPNMDRPLVKERAEEFTRSLCRARPGVPVVMVEDRPLTNLWIKPGGLAYQEEKWREFRAIFEKLRGEGLSQLSYVAGRHLLGDDNEASFDSVHPTDLGYLRMADTLEPVLRALLA